MIEEVWSIAEAKVKLATNIKPILEAVTFGDYEISNEWGILSIVIIYPILMRR